MASAVTVFPFEHIPHPNYANHPAYGKLFGFASPAKRWLALRRFYPHFRSEYRKKTKFEEDRKKAGEPGSSDLYQRLLANGAVALRVMPQEMQRVQELTRAAADQLQARRAAIVPEKRKFGDNLLQLAGDDYKELHHVISDALERVGVHRAASQYLRRNAKFRGVVLQINDDTDIHLKRHFPDIGLSDPPTNYMHIDSTTGILKCLWYLTEVTADTGPFSYVRGSHNLKMSIIEYATRKANDLSRLDFCDPATRQQFWALPSFLQRKAEFGNDLLADSQQAQALLDSEYQFTSADGELIFFDNNEGIHRGSLVRKGSRSILQIIVS